MHNMPWMAINRKGFGGCCYVIDASGRAICNDELPDSLAVDPHDQRIIAAMSRVCVAAAELRDAYAGMWKESDVSIALLRAKARLATALAELEALQ